MENCNYNCTQALSRKKALLWRIPQYVKDAEKAGHPLCAEMWKKIKIDEEKHSEMLQQAIEGLCKEGKFK